MNFFLPNFRRVFLALSVTVLAMCGTVFFTQAVHAANTISSQQYLDMDTNGTVDHIELTFDTNLTACTYDAADWTINTAGTINITEITGFEDDGTCAGASAVLSLIVTSSTTKTGGAVAPVISYANAGTADSLQDSGVITAKPSLTLADGAKPIIRIVDLTDGNTDGLVDEINMVWSEAVDTDDGVAPVAADLPTTVLPDGSTANFGSATISDPAGATSVLTITGVTGQVTINTGIGSTAISGNLSAKWKDANNNVPDASATTGQETVTEIMAPLVVSSTPTSGAAGVVRTSNMTLTFSESIASLTWSISPTATLTNATALPASVITLTGIKLSGTNTFTILTAPDTNSNDFGEFMSSGAAAISFVVAEAESEETTSEPTYDIAITSPSALSTVTAGQPTTMTWSTGGGTGSVSFVHLAYSSDAGVTWNVVATNTTNDGSYVWDVPADLSEHSVVLRAEGTDLVTVLATDLSDTFVVHAMGEGTESGLVEEETSDETLEESSDEYQGQYIKGESWTTVYYIDGTLRYPFMDTQTFLTYEESFDDVMTVADDVLANYDIGRPMFPNPGVVLVKIQSIEKVYALTDSVTLRWITSEDLAVEMYGSDWAEYVIDVPVTAWGHFTVGEDVEHDTEIVVDRDIMKTREEVSA